MSEVTPKEPEPQAETLDLINSEISASLARQSDSGKNIDTKAVVLVGYAVAAAAFLELWVRDSEHKSHVFKPRA